MKQLRRTSLCLFAAALIGLGVASSARGATHALLIGISDYPEGVAGLTPLDGPKNDIALVRGLLTSVFKIPEKNILVLTDKQATHTGIQKAFARLAQTVQPGDYVFIHYSGHGSETADKNGDEPSGLDQTWVPYGARSGKFKGIDDFDLPDDDIDLWLTPIYAETDKVVFISDSCHSGSAGRGPIQKARGVPADPRPYPFAAQKFPVPTRKGVRIGAAQDNELAWEVRKSGKQYGQFSWYWVKALEQARPTESWRAVFDRTAAALLVEQGTAQHPQIEGDEDGKILGGGFTAKAATVPIIKAKGRSVTLGVGRVGGVTERSVYRLYDPGSGLSALAPSVEITHVADFTSKAQVKTGHLKAGDLLVEVEHAYDLDPIHLIIQGDFIAFQDQGLARKIRDSLKDLPGFQITENRASADWALQILRPKKQAGSYVYPARSTIPASDPGQPPEVWVVDPQGKLLDHRMAISLETPEDGIALLKENLAKFGRMQQIKRLKSPHPAPFSITAIRMQPDPACNRDCVDLTVDRTTRTFRKVETIPLADLAKRPPKKNEALTFSVKNDGKRDYYLSLLNISPEGGVWPVFPRSQESQQTALIEAGGQRDFNLRNNTIVFTAPGDEAVKVIVSVNPIDVRLFEVDGYRTASARGPGLNPLERLLSEALDTRGAPPALSNSDWGTLDVAFTVTE